MKKLFAAAALLALLTFAAGFALAAEISIPIRVTLDGHEYALPCPVSEFIENGWRYNTSEALKAQEEKTCFFSKGDKMANMTVKNEHLTDKTVADGMVTDISSSNNVSDDFNVPLYFKGIGVGSTYQEFMNAIPGSELTESSGWVSVGEYLLEENYHYTIIGYYDASGRIDSFIVQADTLTPSAEILAEQDSIPEYRPASFSQYVAPSALGSAPLSGVIELDGKLYQLPFPIEQLANDGWTFSDSEWVAAGDRDWVDCKKDDRIFSVLAHNVMEDDASQSGMSGQLARPIYCEATGVIDETGAGMILPGGLHYGSDEADVLPALEPYAEVTREAYPYNDWYDWVYEANWDYKKDGYEDQAGLTLYVKDGKVVYVWLVSH